MAKRKTRRRFDEPRAGVSQLMIEAEGRELKRELEAYMLQSLSQLRETFDDRKRKYREADGTLAASVGRLPEREQLAVTCMLSRDLFLVLEVYRDFLARQDSNSPVSLAASPAPTLPFCEWLFQI